MKTLHQQTLNRLGEDICSGIYAPGDILPAEPILGEKLGVSRIVLREVIKSISAKGMLEVRRKTGTIVLEPSNWSLFDPEIISWRSNTATLNESMFKELMELRSIIEPAACRLAALRINEEERDALSSAMEAMRGAIDGNGDYARADLAFHTTLLKACRNQFIQQMQNALATILHKNFEIISEVHGGPTRSLPMHETLMQAILDGKPEVAEQAILTIISQAEKDLRESFAQRQSLQKSIAK